jgi:hypothetical protein
MTTGASGLGHSSFSHTGLNNSAFAGTHLGGSAMSGRAGFNGSTFGRSFGGRGFGRGFDRGFRFHDRFGFGCFGCGFGFGFGWGWGWGWGGWWDPWWWGPSWSWWAPPPYYYYPGSYVAPAPTTVPGDYSDYYGSSGSAYNAPYDNPSSGYGSSGSSNSWLNSSLGSPNTNPLTGNVMDSAPTILLYLKDGTMLAASDYWIADNKLHYLVNYGGENTVEMSEVDLQRTVDENGKRGVKFWLKPNANSTTGMPATSPSPAPSPSHEPLVVTASQQPAD